MLAAHDLRIWIDEERLMEDVSNEMSNGIDESAVFVACVTTSFIQKVHGRSKAGLDDVRIARTRKGDPLFLSSLILTAFVVHCAELQGKLLLHLRCRRASTTLL
jgi:hypothetical protein